jgi:hypothetical protein
MAQNAMQSAPAAQRLDYHTELALQLHRMNEHSQLCKLALYLGQRHHIKGDATVTPVLDQIAGLLSEDLDRLPEERLVDFTDGSLEIGWLFNTLSLMGLPGPYHFPYDDFDEFIYRRLVFESCRNISLRKGALGKGIYLLSRYDNNQRALRVDKLKAMELQECLINIVEDIQKLLFAGDIYDNIVSLFNTSNEILYLLLFLSRIVDSKLYPEVARQVMKDVLRCIAAFLCGERDKAGDLSEKRTIGAPLYSSFESWEFLDLLFAYPSRYNLPDHCVGLPAYCSKDHLAGRLASRLCPGSFINYLNHRDINVSGLIRLQEQHSLVSL